MARPMTVGRLRREGDFPGSGLPTAKPDTGHPRAPSNEPDSACPLDVVYAVTPECSRHRIDTRVAGLCRN
jgi:hypothetical protein